MSIRNARDLRERAQSVAPSLLTSLAVAAAALVSAQFLTTLGGIDFIDVAPFAVLVATGLGALAFNASRTSQAVAREVERADENLQDLSERMRQADEPALGILLEQNRIEIDKYHAQTRGLAAKSFYSSIAAMSVALLVLLSGGIAAIQSSSTPRLMLTMILTLVATGLAIYVGMNFMRSHDQALAQLNFYFQQPVVVSYFLAAERMANEIPDGRAEILQRIVEQNLAIATTVSRDAASFLRAAPSGSTRTDATRRVEH